MGVQDGQTGRLRAGCGNPILEFRFHDSEARFSDEFVVFDELSEELIVGATTMQKWQIRLDFTTETVEYRKTAQRLRV
jgi:hypothetical protein